MQKQFPDKMKNLGFSDI